MQKKIAIIGGGLTGLVAGYELSKKGYKVTIFEKENFLGGLASGFKINDTNLEKVYHHIFKTDKEIISLIEKLGLQKKLKWHESSIGLYYGQKLYPFVTPIDLLKFKPLNLIDKFRTGLVALYLQKTKNWKKFEEITAYEWMKKYCGDKAFKVIWEPLLKGKFHDYYKKVSMAWLWARIHTRGNSKEKVELLGYLDGGFEILIKKLEEKILKNEGKIKLQNEIEDCNKLLKQFDKVIVTKPLSLRDLPLMKGRNPLIYLGAVNVVFLSKQSLSKYYWHNINDLNSPFLAFIQHTNLVGKKNYKNEHIYYMGTYVPHNHKYFSAEDKEICKEFFEYLKKIFPKFDEKQITSKFIFKFKNAQHIVGKNYKVENYKVKNNLYRANFSQIYPEDRGMNFAVKEGKKIIKNINNHNEK